MTTLFRPSRIAAAVLLAGACLPSGMAGAQDRDEFYAIARGDGGRAGQAAPGRSGFNLFGLFGGRRRDVPEITVRPSETLSRPSGEEQNRSVAGENVGGPRAYCVRTCDGFFFPAGPAQSGEARGAQQSACSSLCPGAETVLYTVGRRGSIEDAVNARGQTYAALRTAFRFREGVDRACSCQGAATQGLARLPITHDFTLRPGDLVVTETGARIFRGASRFPYRAQDFVAARSYGRLPADVRRRVEEIQDGIRRDAPQAASQRLPRPFRGQAAVQPPPAVSIPVSGQEAEPSPVRVIDMSRRQDGLLR